MIVTLRADFYDRPLSVPELAELMQTRTATVVPLTEELERAIDGRRPGRGRAGTRARGGDGRRRLRETGGSRSSSTR